MAAAIVTMLKRWVSAPAAVAAPAAEREPAARCAVCMDEAGRVSLCGGACDARLCAACAREYLRGRAGESRAFCPRVACPGPECGAYVPMERWVPHAAPETAENYAAAAKAMLTLQCASCDVRQSLLPDAFEGAELELGDGIEGFEAALARHLRGERDAADEVVRLVVAGTGEDDDGGREELRRTIVELRHRADEQHAAAMAMLEREDSRPLDEADWALARADKEVRYRSRRLKEGRAGKIRGADVGWLREGYEAARRAHEEAVAARRRAFDSPAGEARRCARAMVRDVGDLRRRANWEEQNLAARADPVYTRFVLLLQTVQDAERRATLMLALVRKRPVVHSRCHGRAHCFNCKTTNLHDGVTCEEHQRGHLPQEVRFCPGCRMPLLKGDGCSSIKCVCGHQFRWSDATDADGSA